jgi:hypothetical protein
MAITTIAFAATASQTMTISMDVQEIALIGFTAGAVITLDIAPPAQAGLVPLNDATHTTERICYTSCVPSGQTRKVQVSFDPSDPDRPPAGTELRVVANPVLAVFGSAAPSVTIGDAAQDFVTNIGNCRTGTGNGPRLRYTLAVTNAALLAVTSVTVTVAYTLTDAS